MKKNLKMFITCGVLFAVIPLMAETEMVNGYTWTYRFIGDTVEIFNYNSGGFAAIAPKPTGVVAIPSTLSGKPVTSIGYYAFGGCSDLTSVTIPNSVTNIGGWAFYNCSGLTSMTIPDSVTSIGDFAFGGCSDLTSVTIPNSVTSIGGWAFYNCNGLTNVTIPDRVADIGQVAFCGCSSLTNVSLPNSVAYIGPSAFYGCSSLTSVVIPNSVTNILDSTFCGCSGLTKVTLGDSVKFIDNSAFRECTSLEEIEIFGSIDCISANAFEDCPSLRRLMFCGEGSVAVGELPDLGYVYGTPFKGWFSEQEGGNKLQPNEGEVAAGSVYYARRGIPTSADLEFPDSMTVGDEDYNWFTSDGTKTWIDRVIAVYDQDGDVIPPDSYSIDIIRFNGEYEESIESYPKAGEYSVRVTFDWSEYWVVKTFMVEKAYYEMPNGFECYVDGYEYYYSGSGYSSTYNLGCFTDSSVVQVRGYDGSTPSITVYDYFLYSWDWPGYYGGCSDSSHYSIIQDYECFNGSGWQDIQFNTAGRYTIEVSTSDSWWEDDWYCTHMYGTTETIEVYVEPLPLSDLVITAESDLVYTGEAIENSDWSWNPTTFFNGKVRLDFSEDTSLFVEIPVSVTNAGTYQIAVGVYMDEFSVPYIPIPTTDGSHVIGADGWYRYTPHVEGHNSRNYDRNYDYADELCYAVNYTGLVYVTYTVLPRPVSEEQACIVPRELHCDGTPQTCSFVITNDYNGAVLVEGLDYDVAYANNILAGTATATVTCKGNYTGTFSQQFEILPSTNVVEVLGLDRKWTTGGDKEWFSEWFEAAHDGVSCMRSGAIGDNQESWIETVVTNTGVVSFWWKASSEEYRGVAYDKAVFSVDDVDVASIGGETDWTNVTYAVEGNGPHALRWTYRKDASDYGGQDCAWLDEVQYLREVRVAFADGGATDGSVPATETIGEGLQITLPDQGSLAWPKHRFTGWRIDDEILVPGTPYALGYDDVTFTAVWEEKRVSAPTIEVAAWYDTERTAVTMGCETAGATIHYTLDGSTPTAASSVYAGSFYLAGSATIKAIAVLDDFFDSDIVSAESVRAPWTTDECLNAPGLAFNLGGDAIWVRDRTVTHDGDTAMRSGTIGNNQNSWIETSVSGAGTLTFWWKVSSEAYKGTIYDYARFTVDGVAAVPDIGGEIGWRSETVTITGNGTHTIRWTYIKDAQDMNGSDCAWLDEVTWTPIELPDSIPPVASDDEVAAALSGTTDASLVANVTNAAQYATYRAWALSVTNATTTAQTIKESARTWLSYALGADALIDKELTSDDVKIESFTPASTDGKFEFTVSVKDVNIGGGSVAAESLKENLKKVLGIEGSTTLSQGAFSSDNIDITFDTPVDGKARFTVTPPADAGNSFFMRVKVK